MRLGNPVPEEIKTLLDAPCSLEDAVRWNIAALRADNYRDFVNLGPK
jgi:hypothetical protein